MANEQVKVSQETLEAISKMMPQEKVEETEIGNVACKMMVEGRPDDLTKILKTILETFNVRDTYGNVNNKITKSYVMTFMLEEKMSNSK